MNFFFVEIFCSSFIFIDNVEPKICYAAMDLEILYTLVGIFLQKVIDYFI